jgi:hypothetical protein
MTNTYIALSTITLATAQSSVTFGSIPQTYRDLVLVLNGTMSVVDTIGIRFNSDSGSNYFGVSMNGSGSSASSDTWTSITQAFVGVFATTQTTSIIQIQDYSVTDKHTTILSRTGAAGDRVRAHAFRWANSAAISSITFTSNGGTNYQSGTTFSLYGIAG